MMHPLLHTPYLDNDLLQQRDKMVATLKQRFKTYGYQQIQTATLEPYDLYVGNPKIGNTDEMIKVMDTSGKVLVLRPDVTIPITQQIATAHMNVGEDTRLFYIMDVFGYRFEDDQKQRTQAGVEYFSNRTPAGDAEVIALAIHILKDCGFPEFKLEIGHAGFFRALLAQANLSNEQIAPLQTYIQTKNIAEMVDYLATLPIQETVKEAMQHIPFLYGEPNEVMEGIKQNGLNGIVQAELTYLVDVYNSIQAYGLTDHIVFNLGLINDMNYYSDVIFQGFVNQVGNPVVMGGRYDGLGDYFGARIPAIGFAFDVDLLLHAAKQHGLFTTLKEDEPIAVSYNISQQKEALAIALALRERGYAVVTYSTNDNRQAASKETVHIICETDSYNLYHGEQAISFQHISEVIQLLQERGS
ncbi:ATP phosphoribosyltransferase regulatory subunit [Virgibacillus dokdonensis]|uniref:ATP phosphoribosyltransferase regulatory subunit n=1 Tax=Virgibacillus dokdonensis TaxID=302167 RepID=A0ABU7VLI8_9BACI